MSAPLAEVDPDIAELLGKELKMFVDRQEVTGALTIKDFVRASYKAPAGQAAA